MIKRRTGIYLIILLVITGLAGALNDNTVSKADRKAAIELMKENKIAVQKAVKGLSELQLNYKSSPENWSVKECVYHIVIAEKIFWDIFERSMQIPADPEKRITVKLNDEQIIKITEGRTNKVRTADIFEPMNAPYHSVDEALIVFNIMRNDHLKYMRTTTEDLRNHFADLPFGRIDCYQLYLVIGAHSNRHLQQIEELKTSAGFPKN
jgi:hypothetical protein